VGTPIGVPAFVGSSVISHLILTDYPFSRQLTIFNRSFNIELTEG